MRLSAIPICFWLLFTYMDTSYDDQRKYANKSSDNITCIKKYNQFVSMSELKPAFKLQGIVTYTCFLQLYLNIVVNTSISWDIMDIYIYKLFYM